MHIQVKRVKFDPGYTIGELSIDGIRYCWTLEDTVRETPYSSVEEWKIPGETAMPAGVYSVVVDESAHFGRLLPHVLNVPGFEGIRIHPGNTDKNTEGCLLVGLTWTGGDFIGQSRDAFEPLFARIVADIKAGKPVVLDIA